MHREPLRCGALLGADAGAQLFVEDFGATARDGLHAGFAELPQPFVEAEARATDHVGELDGRERLDGRLGQHAFHAADHVEVVVQTVVWMHAPDDMDLRDAPPAVGAGHGDDFIGGHLPRLRTPFGPAVGAEAAVEEAQVGGLDVEIAVVEDPVAAH